MLSYARRMKLDCTSENVYTTVTQKKVDCFNLVGFCGRCNAVFEAVKCFYHYCPCQEAQPALTEEDSQRGKKKAMDELWKQYIEKKYHAVKRWEWEWWKFYKTDVCVKQQLREIFPTKRPFFHDQILEETKPGVFSFYVQCDINFRNFLREYLAKFPPSLKIQT